VKPAPFEYARPGTLSEALSLLSTRGDAKVLAGGQSLVPMMNFRVARPEMLIDINRLPNLDYHRVADGDLVIGALARHATLRSSRIVLEACPLMADAYQYVAHGPIRNRGTLCGNLCHADPASEMPAVALAANATMIVKSAKGERRIAAQDFFKGIYATAVKPDELLIEVRIPLAKKGQGSAFAEVSVRKGDFAMAGAAAIVSVTAGKVSEAAVAICGVGDRPRRLLAAEKELIGAAPVESTFARIASAAAASVDPQSDVNADADYRRDLVRTLVARVLVEAARKSAR
jgi:carbon-monoxide dehydrogenase medium subunit